MLDQEGLTRRDFTKSLFGTIASYSLLQTLFTRDVFAREVRPITDSWVKDLHEMGLDLTGGKITPSQWQAKIKQLFDRVELQDLLTGIDFAKLSAGFEYPDLGVNTRRVEFPRLDGLPENLAFYSKIFGMKRDRAIIPHGHRNMVSCHYVLQGQFHLRHYDKMEEDATHMVIQPTIDRIVTVGSHSSISDEKNNIHWLRAKTETAFTYDVLILDLNGKPTEIDNIDPYEAEKVGGGLLRVKRLGVDEALKKYGHDTHH